jgi:hypothetical protein
MRVEKWIYHSKIHAVFLFFRERLNDTKVKNKLRNLKNLLYVHWRLKVNLKGARL